MIESIELHRQFGSVGLEGLHRGDLGGAHRWVATGEGADDGGGGQCAKDEVARYGHWPVLGFGIAGGGCRSDGDAGQAAEAGQQEGLAKELEAYLGAHHRLLGRPGACAPAILEV